MALPASRRSGGKSGKYRVLRHRLWPVVINSLPFIIISLYVQLAPHTKVEESFYLHAIHDGGVLGLPPRNETLRSWDHIAHPGPVPRSFMPVWLWVALSQYLTWACSQLGLVHTGVGAQKLVRTILGWMGVASLTLMASTIRRATGRRLEGDLFLLLSVTQFHIPFYASRTLPNFVIFPVVTSAFALALRVVPLAAHTKNRLSTLATGGWIDQPFLFLARLGLSDSTSDNPAQRERYRKSMTLECSLGLISWVAATMRAEVALLVGGLALALVVRGHRSLFWTAQCVAMTAILGGSYEWYFSLRYWGRRTWAEVEGILFNVLQGKSSDWGVSPWHTYLSAHLPKLLMFSLPLAIYAFIDPKARRSLHGWRTVLLLPSATMVLGMSCLGHKEWRFIAYVVPLVNIVAAFGASALWMQPTNKSPISKLPKLIVAGGLLANTALTCVLVGVSIFNYPGGVAVERMREIVPKGQSARVYLHHWPVMTGASLYTFDALATSTLNPEWFTETSTALSPPALTFNKTETLAYASPRVIWDEGFDYIIAGRPFDEDERGTEPWHKVASVVAFGGLRRRGLRIDGIKWVEDVTIWGRRAVPLAEP